MLTLAAGPVFAAAAGLACHLGGLNPAAAWCAAITTWCATWWILEPVPIPATSLIPFFAFPLTGVMSAKEVAVAYGDDIILLFLGGFMLSVAMERAGAHRRLALGMVRAVGGRGGRWLVLGFMLAGGLISMWISNTATALVMLPVAIAVLEQADDARLAAPLLLGVAYSTSIGGIGTPIGTPPNLVFISNYAQFTGVTVNFWQWMKIGVPVVVVCLPLAWLYLTRKLRGPAKRVDLPVLGPWRPEEVRVLAIFAVTALLWITREVPGGGWSGLLSTFIGFDPRMISDATVALAAVLVLFIMPSGRGGDGSGEALLDWETAVKIPWGILLLFAGGLAISRGFTVTGLGAAMGNALAGLQHLPPIVMIAGICLAVTFLTEVTSNTATATLLMPVLAAAAVAAEVDPAVLMVPAAISASCAFMLPVATPPNAVVYGTGRFALREMAREGLALNFICAAAITIICYFLLDPWASQVAPAP